MAISNASRLSDFGSGIGSEGAVIQVDNSNKRLGVGTDTPLAMLQVGSGVSVYGDSGIVSATTYYGSGASLTGIAATDHVSTFDLVVAGIATFHNDVRVTAGGLDVVGVVTSNNKVVATGLDIGTAGVDIDGQTDLDELVVAGVATFSAGVDISTGGVDIDGQLDVDELQVAGVSTFSAKAVFNTAYPSIDADNEIQVGTAIQLGKAGVITATSFEGSGANLTGVSAGLSLKQAGSWISAGTAATTVNFASGATITNVDSGGGYPGIATITISAGVSTANPSQTNGIVTIDLSAATDHEVTASGICTITCTSTTTQGESQSLRIINSGITTVGFSTYFLWPSGGAPSIPTADGTISLISYTIHRNGKVGFGTQLLSGASLNFS